MSQGIHFLSSNIAGYRTLEGKCFLCSGGTGVAVSYNYPPSDFKSLPHVMVFAMKNPLSVSKRTLVCSASSSGHRKNPDFSRQNKQNHGFSRGKNRQNPDKGNSESLEESEILSSKNGPLLSLSNTARYQATATPGPREKEIVELFRKVQAQLRERAAMKEEKKIEASKEQGRESETVDSLLKLLRKHSVDRKRRSSSSRDYFFGQLEQNSPFEEEQSSSFFESNSSTKEDTQEANEPNAIQFKRPVSNFRRRSPVPRLKYQPVYSTKNSISSAPPLKSSNRGKKITVEPETMPVPVPVPVPVPKPVPEPEPELELEFEPELESYSESLDVRNEELDDIAESEPCDTDETYNGVAEERPSSTEQSNLNSLKLTELRVLAKSRGVKGYSKMKKCDLIELLNGIST